MSLNITNITSANVTSWTDFITLANDLSGGVFIGGVFFAMYVISFTLATSATNDPVKGAAGSSFVMLVLSVLMMLAGWIDYWYPVLTIIVMSLSLFASKMR